MDIIILGAGTAIPAPQRSTAGVLVRIDGTPLLFDMGPGTIARLGAAGVQYGDLEHIFLTHLHSDHTLDLATFLQVNGSTPGWTRTRPVYLTGCQGTHEFYTRLLDLYPGIAPESYAVHIREVGAERMVYDRWIVETALTGHTASSLAYRVEAAGKALVYTGDATETSSLVHLAQGADLLISECAFPRGWQTADHLTADAVGRLAQSAQVKQVILTHLYPPALQADIVAQVHEQYSSTVTLAVDGMRIAL